MSATPILDLGLEPPAPRRRALRVLLGLIIGLAIGALPILADQRLLLAWNWPAFNGLLILPGLLLSIALHETGHLIAGKLVGLEAGGISIGPIQTMRSGGNWIVEFKWRRMFCGFFKPLVNDRHFRAARYVWMVAGGPLANLILAALCGFLFAHFGSGVGSWIGTLFWISLFLALVSGVPFSSGLQKSDGARVLQLLLRPSQARGFAALIAIQTQEAHGIRPREWDAQLVERLLAVDRTALEYLNCQLFLFYRRLDEEDEWAALQHLENVLASSGKASAQLRPALFLEAASACARIKQEARKAHVWRDRALPLLHEGREALQTADASIAMCEGRYPEALQLWQSARTRVLQRKLDSGLTRFALIKWLEFEQYCRQHMSEAGEKGH